jgi:lipoate---protein ligase
MKPYLNLLKLENVSLFQQLQLEEALLRTHSGNWCLVNEGSSPAVVLGISGKAETLIDIPILNKHHLPIIRRFSGGGTVVVDENTIFVSLICNTDAADVLCFPKQILHWNGNLYNHPLRNTDFRVTENDYAIGTQKFGGNAQYICKNRWLHHSTLLWDFNPDRMRILKMPPKIPCYRKQRSHEEFLCKLNSFLNCKNTFKSEFIESVSKHFDIQNVAFQDAIVHLKRPHRKATTLL